MVNYNSYLPQTYTSAPYAYGVTASPITMASASTPSNSAQVSAINWVQGEAGAKSVNVPAGQTALLMDSETNHFYVKSSDVSGFPLPIRVFKYEEVVKSPDSVDSAPSTYVTKEELDEQLKQFALKLKEEKPHGKFDI